MIKSKIIAIFFIIFYVKISLFAQNQLVLDNSFKFKEGIFLNYDQVKSNQPIPKSNIISNIDKNSYNFFEILFLEKQVDIINEEGKKEKYLIKDLWGYSDKGFLYVNYKNYTSQIHVLGAICHFMATEEVYTGYTSTYYESFSSPTTTIVNYQAIMDFETGNIMPLNISNLTSILAKDTEITKEWSDLSKNKKKKQMFVFIQKYNQKNPVYIQSN